MNSTKAAARGSTARPGGKTSRPALPILPIAVTALALAGLGVSLYLLFTRLSDDTIVCAGLGQCDYVNQSKYATLLGVPISAYGAALYAALLASAAAWVARPQDDLPLIAAWAIALAGAGYSAYLTYVEVAVLEAICVWCVVSALILATTLVLTTFALFRQRPEQT